MTQRPKRFACRQRRQQQKLNTDSSDDTVEKDNANIHTESSLLETVVVLFIFHLIFILLLLLRCE